MYFHTPSPQSIALAQIPVEAGNIEKNIRTIKDVIRQTADKGYQLVALGEMVVTGYLIGDQHMYNPNFIQDAIDANDAITAVLDENNMGGIWGNFGRPEGPTSESFHNGKRNFTNRDGTNPVRMNSAYVYQNGVWVSNGVFTGITHKTNHPSYRYFDDDRYYSSMVYLAQYLGKKPEELLEPFPMMIDGRIQKVGVVICEDMWSDDYDVSPVDVLVNKGVEVIINLSASPFGLGKANKRERVLSERSKGVTFYYVNRTGSENNGKNLITFDGGTVIYYDGQKIAGGSALRDMRIIDSASPIDAELPAVDILHGTLVDGIRDAWEKGGQKRAIIGLSGGADSALSLCLLVEALGAENVCAINMPTRFNTNTTKGIAHDLAMSLGVAYITNPIEDMVQESKKSMDMLISEHTPRLQELGWDISHDSIHDENHQARIRGSLILSYYASRLKAVYPSNGNKLETAMGYATLYGDVNGFLAPLGDLWKTQIFEQLQYQADKATNPQLQNVLQRVLSIPPSAELSDAQNPEEGKGDPFVFEYHDSLMALLMESNTDPGDILEMYQNGSLNTALKNRFAKKDVVGSDGYFTSIEAFITDLERLWRGLAGSEFKRIQGSPVLAVSKRAFGFDYRRIQGPAYWSEKYLRLKRDLLGS